MRLSDLFSAVDMTVYPVLGLLIFLGVFIAVAVRAARSKQSEMDYNAMLPLEDAAVADDDGRAGR